MARGKLGVIKIESLTGLGPGGILTGEKLSELVRITKKKAEIETIPSFFWARRLQAGELSPRTWEARVTHMAALESLMQANIVEFPFSTSSGRFGGVNSIKAIR